MMGRLSEYYSSDAVQTEVSIRLNFPDPPKDTIYGLEWYGINIQPPTSDRPDYYNGQYVGFATETELRKKIIRHLPPERKIAITVSRVNDVILATIAEKQPTLCMVVPNKLYDAHSGFVAVLTPAEFAWAAWQGYIDLWCACEISTNQFLELIERGFNGLTKPPITSELPF